MRARERNGFVPVSLNKIDPKPVLLSSSFTLRCLKKTRNERDVIYLCRWLYAGGHNAKVDGDSAMASDVRAVSAVLYDGGSSIGESVGFSGAWITFKRSSAVPWQL